MFGETTMFYIKIWNHPTETTIKKWMFRVPGMVNLLNMYGIFTGIWVVEDFVSLGICVFLI